MSELKLEDLSRLSVKPGDIVVVRGDRLMPQEAAERIRDQISGVIARSGVPNVQVIVLANDIELSVFTPDDVIDVTELRDQTKQYRHRSA